MIVTAVVEIPQGSYYKYELKDGILMLDRVLLHPYPYNYGCVPGTMCEDGDALDVFILSDQPIHPTAHVKIRLVGIINCIDNGQQDDKLLAAIDGDPFPEDGKFLVSQFLRTYKPGFVVNYIGNEQEAVEAYKKALICL